MQIELFFNFHRFLHERLLSPDLQPGIIENKIFIAMIGKRRRNKIKMPQPVYRKIINFITAPFVMNFIAIVPLTSHQVESHYASEIVRFWKLKISFAREDERTPHKYSRISIEVIVKEAYCGFSGGRVIGSGLFIEGFCGK